MNIDKTLEDRGNDYGEFKQLAYLSQSLKRDASMHPKWNSLTSDKQEAIEMILHKIARIINGDSSKKDSWHDISGYATLISKNLEEK